MAWPPVRRTPVNGVLVVEASAGRVQLNQLVAHREDFVELLSVGAGKRQRLIVDCR
jgi:hypothetical protein